MQRLISSASFSPPVAAWLERGRHLNVAGRRVFVIDKPAVQTRTGARAEGAPLLVLHGFPGSSFDWHRTLDALSEHRRVVLFDFPGFGFSDKPERYSYSLFEQADVVEALVERLGLSCPHIVAHDMGVSVACELVARRQRKLLKGELASLLLMNAGVYGDLAKITSSQKVLLTPLGGVFGGLGIGAVFRKQLASVLVRPVDSREIDAMWEQVQYLDGHKRLAQLASYLRERNRFEDRWISALRTAEELPIHLLWGSRDPVSLPSIAERLVLQIPGTELTRLSRVGHFPPIEAPDETVTAVGSWLLRADRLQPATRAARATATESELRAGVSGSQTSDAPATSEGRTSVLDLDAGSDTASALH